VGLCRTFRYQLQPTVRQRRGIEELLVRQCELYNAALEERRGAWRWNARGVSYVDQCRTLTELRPVRPEVLDHGVTVCRGTLKRLDRAFAGFFRRCLAGETPGYPRFRPISRFDSLQWEDRSGWRFSEHQRRLRLLGVGHIKVRVHRPLKGTPKAITVKREARRYYVSIRCVEVPHAPLEATGLAVGIDLGVSSLVATSDGELVLGPRCTPEGKARLAATQRDLARKVKGSKRRRRVVERVAAQHRAMANRRRDVAHKLSKSLVARYDLIVHEDLKVRNMLRRPVPKPAPDGGFLPNGARAKAGLNRSIADAGWGELLSMITYKAESAGRRVTAVAPPNTALTCPNCGQLSAENRPSQAVFCCVACGHSDHADLNAARNILGAGRALQASACVG